MDLFEDGMARGVAAGDGEGGVRNVRGVDRCASQFFCESNGNAAGAGADVGDFEAFAGARLLAAGADFADRAAGAAARRLREERCGRGAAPSPASSEEFFLLTAASFVIPEGYTVTGIGIAADGEAAEHAIANGTAAKRPPTDGQPCERENA